MTALPLDPAPALPAGYDARVPTAEDVERVAALVTDHRRRVRGGGSVDIVLAHAFLTVTASHASQTASGDDGKRGLPQRSRS